MQFYKLRVAKTKREVAGNAKSVSFDIPPNLKDTFTWRPGQHVTLRFELDGADVRRSYSISSSPLSGTPLRITVKRVKGGLVSNYINDNVEVGQTIEVMPPFGGFCLDPDASRRRTHYFFAAGSGITPIFAMLESILISEPHSVAHLIYGNTSAKTILFREELIQLVESHPNRISVQHVLSAPSLWSSFSPWRTGKIDAEAIGAAIDENPPYAQDAQYYICGPGGMNAAGRQALMGLDVPAGRIHSETYGGDIKIDDSVEGIAATARIRIAGTKHEVAVAAGQTVLDALRAASLKPPFSCQSGVCGACRATLSKGTVHMRARMALEDNEIERGAILTCQAVATSADVEIAFE